MISTPSSTSVLLLNPTGWWLGSVNIGLAYLSASLEKSGANVTVLDLNHADSLLEGLEERIRDSRPEVVGISIKSASYRHAVDLAEFVKRIIPEAVIVGGGPHVTLYPEGVLDEVPEIDYVLSGEAEESFPALIEALRTNGPIEEVPGIGFRREGLPVVSPPAWPADLETLEFPDFTRFVDLDRTGFIHPIVTSRGCPYRCSFCLVPGISGRKWRAAGPEKVLDEIRHFAARGVKIFDVWDDNFTLDVERAAAICEGIIDADLGIGFQCVNGLRARGMTKELVRLMKRAGCRSVFFGIETGDPDLFRTLDKGEDLEDIIRAVGLFRGEGIPVGAHFVVGLPGDSLHSVRKSIRFAKKLGLGNAYFNQLVPYPKTRVYDEIAARGTFLRDFREGVHMMGTNWSAIPATYEMPEFTAEEMREALRLAFEAFDPGGPQTGRGLKKLVHRGLAVPKRWLPVRTGETVLLSVVLHEEEEKTEKSGFYIPLGAAKRAVVTGPKRLRGVLDLSIESIGNHGARGWTNRFEVGEDGTTSMPCPVTGGPNRGLSRISLKVTDRPFKGSLRVDLVG